MNIIKQKGVLLILAAGCFWGAAPLFTNGLFDVGVSSVQVAGIRALVSCIAYWTIGWLNQGRELLCPPRDAAKLILSGAASVGVMYLTYTLCMFFFDAALAVIFLYTAPVYVALYMAGTGREVITFPQAAGVGLILLGTVLSAGGMDATQLSATGLLTGILCGISYALVTIFRKTIQADYSVFQVTAYTTLGAVFTLLPFIDFETIPFSATTCVCFLGNGVLSTALPQFLYLMGLDFGVSGAVGSSLSAIELIVAGMCGALFLNETSSPLEMAGLAIVFGGVILAVRKNKHHENRKE